MATSALILPDLLFILFCDENGISIGKDPLVKRFMKGVFESRPPLPRYVSTRDVNIVISYLKLIYRLLQFSLDHVTCKTGDASEIDAAQRTQTLI